MRSAHKHGWLAWTVVIACGCEAPAPSRPAEAPVAIETFPPQRAVLQPGEAYVPPWPAGTTPPPPTTPPMVPVPGAPDGGTAPRSVGGVTGGMVTNAADVVRGMAPAFRRCYAKGLQQDTTMVGTVRVTAKIGPNGDVLSLSTSGAGLSEVVFSCVAARVFEAQFSPPEGGGATIIIPVRFAQETAAPSAGPATRPAPLPPKP